MKNIFNIRKQIDAVDKDIIALLERRLSLVREVAKIKNEEKNVPLTDQTREDTIIRILQKQTNDLILRDTIADVYNTIFRISKAIRYMEKQSNCPFSHVGIIGDGLIGRSIARAIESKKDTRVKVTIHNREWRIENYATCELIIIATPIDTVIDVAVSLAQNQKSLHPGVVILDVASVKGKIAKKFAQLNKPCFGTAPIFVPTHPMGGKQECGSKYAQSTLFAGRPWIITPVKSTQKQTLAMISSFVAYCGSRPIIMGAEQHDRLAAYISHFPGLLSKMLSDFVSEQSEESLALAGSGYEMMTRIGMSKNLRMRSQISGNNSLIIHDICNEFIYFIKRQDLGIWKTSQSS